MMPGASNELAVWRRDKGDSDSLQKMQLPHPVDLDYIFWITCANLQGVNIIRISEDSSHLLLSNTVINALDISTQNKLGHIFQN